MQQTRRIPPPPPPRPTPQQISDAAVSQHINPATDETPSAQIPVNAQLQKPEKPEVRMRESNIGSSDTTMQPDVSIQSNSEPEATTAGNTVGIEGVTIKDATTVSTTGAQVDTVADLLVKTTPEKQKGMPPKLRMSLLLFASAICFALAGVCIFLLVR